MTLEDWDETFADAEDRYHGNSGLARYVAFRLHGDPADYPPGRGRTRDLLDREGPDTPDLHGSRRPPSSGTGSVRARVPRRQGEDPRRG